MPKPSKWSIQELSKVLKVSGNAVGQTSLEVGPDKLVGVKLRRISREVNGVDSRIVSQVLFDELGPVERAPVPEKHDGPSEVATKVPEEVSDLFGPNVLVGIKARVESKPFSLGRDRDGGDRRDLGPASGDHEGWSLSFDRPRSLDVGNKRESAFIQEGQAGSKLSGLFLYAARRGTSSNGYLLRAFPWLFWSGPDNSNPGSSSDSRDSRYSSAPRIVSGSPVRYVSMSKDPSSNRLPKGLSPRRAPGCSFDAPTNAGGDLYSELIAVPSVLSSGRSGASAPRSLTRRSVSGLLNGRYGPVSTNGRPSAAAFLTFGGCREVSSSPPRLPR